MKITKKQLRKIIKEASSRESLVVDWNELDENKWQISGQHDPRVGHKLFGVYDYSVKTFDKTRPSWNPNPEIGHVYIPYSGDDNKKYPVFVSADGKKYQIYQYQADDKFITLRTSRSSASIDLNEIVEFLNDNMLSLSGYETLLSGQNTAQVKESKLVKEGEDNRLRMQEENKMKITKRQLRKIIRESMMQHQGEWNPSSNVPSEAFGGGGDDRMKEIIIGDAASFYSVSPEEVTSALGDLIDLSPENISKILNDTLAQARQAMPFDERYGPGKEARMGKYVLQILRGQQ